MKPNKVKFQCWLVKNGLSMRAFAKKCEVSVNYISMAVNGKITITDSVKETFKRGGYEL